MHPDLAFPNVLACALGVASILFVIGRMFFPDLIPSPALRRSLLAGLYLLVFLPPLLDPSSVWSRYIALGGLAGLVLAAAAGLAMLAYLASVKLRTRQLRERIAVHRHLTRHHRE